MSANAPAGAPPGTAARAVTERRHVLQDLGWSIRRDGDGLVGSAAILPQMCVPGTGHLRTSILATWADHLSGILAMDGFRPRVPVTLELDVNLYRSAPGTGTLRGTGTGLKSGRSVFVASVELTHDGEAIGFGAASFMASPDERLRIGPISSLVDQAAPPTDRRLDMPFADRAGCERRGPGVAVLRHSDESLNASNTINGGLIALAAEEAALSLSPGATLSSLGLRYLQPARVGPAVARAEVRDGLGRVEVRDAGNGNRLCVLATCRLSPADGPDRPRDL